MILFFCRITQISGNIGGRAAFLQNPQFLVALADPDLEDENATSTVVISLSQKVRLKHHTPTAKMNLLEGRPVKVSF